MIYGEAGTGKSLTVGEICKNLQQCGTSVQVVCSTGVACDVYSDSKIFLKKNPVTVNSFLGFLTAKAPFQAVVRML